MKERKYTDNQLCCFLFGLTFLMMLVLGMPLSVSYILDETGTVANAAFLAGYNWNDWVNSTGGYFYKYGQAPFYFLFFKFFSNPYMIYKGLMLINGLFVACIPVISYKILRKHLGIEEQGKCMLLSFCIAVVPAPVLYSLFARADVMLISCAWFVLYTLLESMDAEQTKEKVWWSSLTGFLSIYIYMCHSRGIVFVIAMFMVTAVIRFWVKNKGICFSAYLLNVFLWLAVDKKLTSFFKNSIWGSGNKKNTFENVNYDKYATLLTPEGIETVIKNITGWFFNSFLGTFGLVTLGVFFAVVICVFFFSKKKNINAKEVAINLYALLACLGTGAMGILFFFGSNYKFVTGISVKRADRFLYSRYLSPCYALLIFIALYYLFIKKDCFGLKTKIATVVFGGGLIVYCRSWLPGYVNKVEYSWRNTIDSALFFDTVRYGNDANTYKGVSRALLIMAVVSFLGLIFWIILSEWKMKRVNLCFVFIGASFLLSLGVNYVKLRYATDVRPMLSAGAVITWMDNLEDKTDISEEYHDVYVDKSFSRHKTLQMGMPQYTVHVKKSVAAEDVDDMFIIVKNYVINEKWAGDDCYLFSDYDFENTQATVLVKGEQLKEALEDKGIELVPVTEEYTQKKLPGGGTPFLKAVKKVFDFQVDAIFN
ncbi:MAG: hypothetical protein NC347_12705 [Clostridium sp.]|nr:hypothetical protein [Clostridium sp.]